MNGWRVLLGGWVIGCLDEQKDSWLCVDAWMDDRVGGEMMGVLMHGPELRQNEGQLVD